jgi:hypothetical protein
MAAAIGGAAAFAAKAFGHPETAAATHAGYAQLDHTNVTTGTAFGHSPASTVVGLARAEYAVGAELFPVPNTVCVRALTTGLNSQVGLDGDARGGNGEGIAVRARTKNGIGVYAEATGGYGLQVEGRAVFSRSGRATVAASNSSRTVSGYPISPPTLVVATIQGNHPGYYVRGVSLSDAQDTFTIRLNKAAPTGGIQVGFFIVN